MRFTRLRKLFIVIIAFGMLSNIIWMFNQGYHINMYKNIVSLTTYPKCPNISVSETALPLTALISWPGSGNTWTRRLLEGLTGFATGSDDYDESLYQGGFIGEKYKDGGVIAVKSHKQYTTVTYAYTRAILIVRNPYNALLADFNRHHSNSHIGVVPLTIFFKNWNKWFNIKAPGMYKLYHSWITALEDVLVIFYENLEENLPNEMERVCVFLHNMTCNIYCALQEVEGNFHRPHGLRPPVGFFYDSGQLKFLNTEIDKLHELLVKYNHSFYNVLSYKQPVVPIKTPS